MTIGINDVDGPPQELKYMAEFASELSCNLDIYNAHEGFFSISQPEGNQLAFCCNDILRRVEELIASVSTAAKCT
jgi:hypothetical protein